MRSQEAEDRIDGLVKSFLVTSDETEANYILEKLICGHSLPIIRRIIRSAIRFYLTPFDGSSDSRDVNDISSEVVLKLLKSLRRHKVNPGTDISGGFQCGGFHNYVAVTTYNTCYDYLRAKYPQRQSLKRRIRYTLTHRPDLALWENEEIGLCGLAHWAGQPGARISTERLRELHSGLQTFKQFLSAPQNARSDDLAQTLHTIFSFVGSPVQLDEVVNIVAELLEVRSQVLVAEGEYSSDLRRQIPQSQDRFGTRLEQRGYLERLWEEIILLPLGQRTALLLSLKDSQGNEMITLLDQLRIATLSQIADAVAMSAERFAELWRSSPIDDAAIAKHLGITRQQVINLRLSARRRLARRMEGKARQNVKSVDSSSCQSIFQDKSASAIAGGPWRQAGSVKSWGLRSLRHSPQAKGRAIRGFMEARSS